MIFYHNLNSKSKIDYKNEGCDSVNALLNLKIMAQGGTLKAIVQYAEDELHEIIDSLGEGETFSLYEITDILKCFASYLDKVKRALLEVDPIKGPYTGNMLHTTYLSEVLSIRYRILAGDPTADLNLGLRFIKGCREDFINSMDGRGLFGKNKAVPGAAGGDGVARRLDFG